MIFRRYHQFDAVRKLIAVSREEGPGNNYLIQLSAGSGKSKNIRQNTLVGFSYVFNKKNVQNPKSRIAQG